MKMKKKNLHEEQLSKWWAWESTTKYSKNLDEIFILVWLSFFIIMIPGNKFLCTIEATRIENSKESKATKKNHIRL